MKVKVFSLSLLRSSSETKCEKSERKKKNNENVKVFFFARDVDRTQHESKKTLKLNFYLFILLFFLHFTSFFHSGLVFLLSDDDCLMSLSDDLCDLQLDAVFIDFVTFLLFIVIAFLSFFFDKNDKFTFQISAGFLAVFIQKNLDKKLLIFDEMLIFRWKIPFPGNFLPFFHTREKLLFFFSKKSRKIAEKLFLPLLFRIRSQPKSTEWKRKNKAQQNK